MFDEVLDPKKCVHIKLMNSTHTQFRIESFKQKLTMQDMFEEFARAVVDRDEHAMALIKRAKDKKTRGTIKKLQGHELNSMYDIIEKLGTGEYSSVKTDEELYNIIDDTQETID